MTYFYKVGVLFIKFFVSGIFLIGFHGRKLEVITYIAIVFDLIRLCLDIAIQLAQFRLFSFILLIFLWLRVCWLIVETYTVIYESKFIAKKKTPLLSNTDKINLLDRPKKVSFPSNLILWKINYFVCFFLISSATFI